MRFCFLFAILFFLVRSILRRMEMLKVFVWTRVSLWSEGLDEFWWQNCEKYDSGQRVEKPSKHIRRKPAWISKLTKQSNWQYRSSKQAANTIQYIYYQDVQRPQNSQTLSLSLSLYIRPYLPFLLAGPLDDTECPDRPDECKSLLVTQQSTCPRENITYEFILIFHQFPACLVCPYLDGFRDGR